MLRLLSPTEDGKQPKRYVQEKVISVFTAVVQVPKSKAAFAKVGTDQRFMWIRADFIIALFKHNAVVAECSAQCHGS